MEEKYPNIPAKGNTTPGLQQAIRSAREEFSRVADVKALCDRAGAGYFPESGLVGISYLGGSYIVSCRTGDIVSSGNANNLSIREQLLILHYLLTAKGTEPSGKVAAFQDLPDGHVYYPTFQKRAVNPVVNTFGAEPGAIVRLAAKIGGEAVDMGDAAVTIKAFPHVPVTLVLWGGDDEFEPRGNILFDAGIVNYLPTEDVTILCETIAWKLVKSKLEP
jgi:hypothetical protein